jgi:hypothetical protein
MNRTFPKCLAVVIALSTALALTAAAADGGCKLQGSWIGVEGGELLVAYEGQSSSGTLNEELPVLDLSLFEFYCPGTGALRISSLKGLWARTGGNTFIYTQVGYVVDEGNHVVCIMKNSGKKTLSDGCNFMTVDSTLELFYADQNPFEDDSFFATPLAPIYAYRMRIDPPYAPSE